MINKREDIAILMIDDHHIILEGYKNVLSKAKLDAYNFSFDTADNCDTAWEMLHVKTYQVVFLDINFPVREGQRFLSGEDLGIKIKEKFPDSKLIILTVLEDVFRIHNLLNNINPSGFLLKGETTSAELIRCLEKVLVSPPYYSSKILKQLHSEIGRKQTIDEIDRIILYQLSLGTKTKDLTEYIPLSLRAIEDRKRKLRKTFDIQEKGDKALLDKARESGYI